MRSNVIRCRGAPVWNDDPIGGEIVQATATVIDTRSRVYTFDVSGYVNTQRADGHDVVSFMIQAGAVTSSSIIDFNSKEASSGKPALVLSESGPSVATPAAASPSTVTGTTTSLSVLGADPDGESSLTYTWWTVSQTTGGSLSVSATGTNAAKDVTAYFDEPGTYAMYAVITDPEENSISSNTLTFTVVSTLASIAVTPTPAALNENATQQFSASGLDQFGVALASQPTFTWTNSGVGSVNSTGLYTAPGSTGSAAVTATSGSVSGNASVTVGNAAPTVATSASASPSPVTSTTTTLSVLGADDGGESNLKYTWTATSIPSGATAPAYSLNNTNAAKNDTATFTSAGAYTFMVTITDLGGLYVTSSVSVTVNQTLTSISVTPGTATPDENATQQFAAAAYDQFGVSMATQPTFTWTSSGVGSVNSTGLYTAPGSTGSATVTATSGSLSGNASVTVGNAAPTVATAAAASPSPVTGTTTSLSALGADDGGESNLTYTWTTTSIPSGATAPTYSANDTHAAMNDTATFTSAGAYTFMVTITDLGGLYVTCNVSVTVNQTLTSISVTPGTATLGSDGTQQFAATAADQFGSAMATQPTFAWSNTDAGSVEGTGLYTAPAAAGSDTVTATSGSVSGNASVTVDGPSVATAASASTVDGVQFSLSALGSDPNGESSLTYTWAARSTPDGYSPDFSDNGDNSAKNATAYAGVPGDYTFQVTMSDGTNSVTSTASITVGQVATSVQIDQPGAAIVNGGTFGFTATAYDQFGDALATQPAFTWSVSGAGGTISSGGTYTAPISGAGTDTIVASTGGASADTLVETGPVAGNVYDDGNDDSVPDDGEQGLPCWNVFVDLNGDGSNDTGDPSTVTDANGNFAVDPSTGGSGSGSATLRAAAPSGWSLTQGAAGYAVSTTVGATSGPDLFGAYAAPSMSDNGAAPLSAITGQTFTATVANFSDSAGAESNSASFSATITWGDGTQAPGTVVPEGSGNYSVTGTHNYATAQSCAVTVAIAGAADSLTTCVDAGVSNAAPVLTPIDDQTPSPDSPLTISVPFADADPSAILEATVDWGDGNGPQPAAVDTTSGTVTATLADVPSQPLNATVTLTDQHGVTTTVGVPINDSATVAIGSTPDDTFTPDIVVVPSAAFKVWSVGFGATDPARFHAIRQDGTNNVFGPAVSPANSLGPAEWEDDNLDGAIQSGAAEKDYPICYTRSGPYGDVVPTAGANIIMTGNAGPNDAYQIYAIDDAGLKWGPVNASLITTTLGNGHALSGVVTCAGRIAPRVLDTTVTLNCYVVDTTTSATQPAGTTHNEVYIALNDPTTTWTYTGNPNSTNIEAQSDPIPNPFQTVLMLGCRYADGATTANQVISGAWDNFQASLSTGVKDASGNAMTYWNGFAKSGQVKNAAFFTTTGLLLHHDGRCDAWAGLFADVLRAEGIPANKCSILPLPKASNPDPVPGSMSPGNAQPIGLWVKESLPGQGNASPPYVFGSGHAVVQIGGGGASDTIYDPSYGYLAPNLAAWANHSLDGLDWQWGQTDERDRAPRSANANDVKITPY